MSSSQGTAPSALPLRGFYENKGVHMARNYRPGPITRFFHMIGWLIVLGVLSFLGLFGHLLYKEYTIPQPGTYHAIVVLGAQVDPDGKPACS